MRLIVHVSISRSLPDLVEERPEVGVMDPSFVDAFGVLNDGSESHTLLAFLVDTVRFNSATLGLPLTPLPKAKCWPTHSSLCLRKSSCAEREFSTGSVMQSELVPSITKARLSRIEQGAAAAYHRYETFYERVIAVDPSEKIGRAPAVPISDKCMWRLVQGRVGGRIQWCDKGGESKALGYRGLSGARRKLRILSERYSVTWIKRRVG